MSAPVRQLQNESKMEDGAGPKNTRGAPLTWIILIMVVVACGCFTAGFFVGKAMKVAPPEETRFDVTAKLNQIQRFGSDVKITVIEIAPAEDPTERKVTVKVVVGTLPETQLQNALVGSSLTFPKEHGYTITVKEVGSDFAVLRIRQNR